MDKTERLLNLMALLLDARRPLAVLEIREKITAYDGQSDDAFHRMFERDKNEIRELGIVLEQETTPSGEAGYRVSKEDLLDDPGLTPDEMAALSLAAQAWGGETDESLGLLKLSVTSGDPGAGPTAWMVPRVSFDRSIAALLEAIRRRKVVRFAYRTGGGGQAADRTVEPHGLYHRGGWYLSGFDRDRGEVRNFKLARVGGRITVAGGNAPDFDEPPRAPAGVPHGPWEGDEIATHALVAFAPDAAWWVERRTGARRETERADGWVELRLPVADIEPFASWLAGFADHAIALEPEEVRAAVIDHLRAAEDS